MMENNISMSKPTPTRIKQSLIESGKDMFYFIFGILSLLFGIAGNSLVVIAVWKKRSLRSTTNYLLVSLAISDITNVIFLPMMVVPLYVRFEEGPLADFLCKFFLSYHISTTASVVSILTLVVLSVERYHAVVKPMRTGIRLREDTVKYAIIAVWISAILLTLPEYIYGHYKSYNQSCRIERFTKTTRLLSKILGIVIVFIPFFIISFCYFQIVRELYFKNKTGPQNIAAKEEALSKRKLVKLSLSITLGFIVCFFPLAISFAFKAYDSKSVKTFHRISCVLYFSGSSLNPLLYAFQSTNFRQAFKEILKCKQL